MQRRAENIKNGLARGAAVLLVVSLTLGGPAAHAQTVNPDGTLCPDGETWFPGIEGRWVYPEEEWGHSMGGNQPPFWDPGVPAGCLPEGCSATVSDLGHALGATSLLYAGISVLATPSGVGTPVGLVYGLSSIATGLASFAISVYCR